MKPSSAVNAAASDPGRGRVGRGAERSREAGFFERAGRPSGGASLREPAGRFAMILQCAVALRN